MSDYLNNGPDIYSESFRIIRAEAELERFPADVEQVVVRMIHAAADPAIAGDIAFTPGIVASCKQALASGAPVLCDSSMTASGVIRSRLPRDNEVVCHIKDPALADEARAKGVTKTHAAVDRWAEQGRLDGAVVAIGNAPTALYRVLELCHSTGARPAGIVGIPVGFVGAAESKQALVDDELGLEYITLLGRRGGSAITVAAVNALASRAELTNEHA